MPTRKRRASTTSQPATTTPPSSTPASTKYRRVKSATVLVGRKAKASSSTTLSRSNKAISDLQDGGGGTGGCRRREKVAVRHPIPILILDNGGWNVKHGTVLSQPSEGPNSRKETTSTRHPRYLCTPNCTARLRHQVALLVGDEILTVKNKSQCEVDYSMERGYPTDLECQLKVWTRILQRERERQNVDEGGTCSSTVLAPSASCLFLLVQPFTPTVISDRVDAALFLHLGFQRVSKRLVQCMAAYHYLTTTQDGENGVAADGTECCLVVDSGFSFTHVVPTYKARAVEKAIRRINVGGKLMTNLLKESISYRRWNMMDEFFLMNEVKERLGFVSADFERDLLHARDTPEGRRWFDREFVLPNFVDTFQGTVRLPVYGVSELKNKFLSRGEGRAGSDINDTGIDEAPPYGKDRDDGDDSNDDDATVDSEEETDAQRRERIERQKQEERERREREDRDHQVLPLSVERFTIPEVLFQPSDVAMERAGLGIVPAIVQAVEACDPMLRAAMFRNILLVGGNAKFPGFLERLRTELRSHVPHQYRDVRLTMPDDPVGYAWEGARAYATSEHQQNNDTAESGFLERYSLERTEWIEDYYGTGTTTSWQTSHTNDNHTHDSYPGTNASNGGEAMDQSFTVV